MNRISLHIIHIIAGLLLAVTVACAPAQTGDAASAPRANPNLITQQEVQASNQSNAFEVVNALRPQWLRVRGMQSVHHQGTVVVYYDDTRLGGPETLRQIPANAIVSLRFVDQVTATQRWGLDHGHGAIVVSTRQAPR